MLANVSSQTVRFCGDGERSMEVLFGVLNNNNNNNNNSNHNNNKENARRCSFKNRKLPSSFFHPPNPSRGSSAQMFFGVTHGRSHSSPAQMDLHFAVAPPIKAADGENDYVDNVASWSSSRQLTSQLQDSVTTSHPSYIQTNGQSSSQMSTEWTNAVLDDQVLCYTEPNNDGNWSVDYHHHHHQSTTQHYDGQQQQQQQQGLLQMNCKTNDEEIFLEQLKQIRKERDKLRRLQEELQIKEQLLLKQIIYNQKLRGGNDVTQELNEETYLSPEVDTISTSESHVTAPDVISDCLGRRPNNEFVPYQNEYSKESLSMDIQLMENMTLWI